MKRKPEESIRIYAAGLVLQQLESLTAEINGVKKASDIEYVHRMRVSSRRLRAILEVFEDCLPAKRGADWQKKIRGITKSLGAARDSDVQIFSLGEIYKNLPDISMRPSIRRLILRLRQRRTRQQVQLLSAIAELESSGLLEEMQAAFLSYSARNTEVYLFTPELYKRSFEKINTARQVFFSFENAIQDPVNIKELHAMRIAGKNFRYILECFAPIYSNTLKYPISTMKTAQDLLGNIHDCDIWSLELPKFLEKEHKRTVDYYGKDRYEERFKIGIEYLSDLKKQSRDSNYTTFIKKWEQWKADNVWENLTQTLQIPFFQDADMTPLSLIQKIRNGGHQ